eukprot:scaffold30718_cov39-Isochrysis_galbana.AAC.1
MRPASSGSAPPAVVSATPHPGDEELAFYQSILSRGAGCSSSAPNGKSAPGLPATEAQLSARRALREGTYFVIDGFVCDSRGRELGPASAILGEEGQGLPAE